MPNIYESSIELLQIHGWHYLSPESQESERQNLNTVILNNRLQTTINKINPNVPQEAIDQAIRQVLNLPSQNLIDNNEVL